MSRTRLLFAAAVAVAMLWGVSSIAGTHYTYPSMQVEVTGFDGAVPVAVTVTNPTAGQSSAQAVTGIDGGAVIINGGVSIWATDPDGGSTPVKSTYGGVQFGSHAPMCFSSSCVEVSVPYAGDGGDIYTTITSGQWYEMTVIGDGSGGLAGCWQGGAKINTAVGGVAQSCINLPKVKDGQVKPLAASATVLPDGGASTTSATLWYYATMSGGYSVTLCPEIPCQ